MNRPRNWTRGDTYPAFYVQLGRNIGDRRARLGLSRRALLERIQQLGSPIVHGGSILGWEMARTRITLADVLLLAVALETTMPQLLPIDRLPLTVAHSGIWVPKC